MTAVATTAERPADTDTPSPRTGLRTALLVLIAVALVVLGGASAVALGIGRSPVPSADSVEGGFSRDMAAHHLQGVAMANMALERSDDARVRQLAFDIASTQTNQVGRMQGWLSLWGLPATGGEVMGWMRSGAHDMAGMEEGALMPGMAHDGRARPAGHAVR